MQTMNDPVGVAQWLRQRVTGALQCDSRQVQPGDAFVAWPGAATDGRRFVPAALQAGAVAVLVEADGVEGFALDDERVLAVPGLKALAGPIASAYHADPSAEMALVAFTGTNGKTSSAWWMAQLLSAAQRPCALVGTLGIGRPPLADEAAAALVPTGLTTPDPVLLQSCLRGLLNDGVTACAIEASSIGLVEGRLTACHIQVAVFTNFTQDHLDFHGSMARYWDAKAALFAWPGLRAVVINLDDPQGGVLHQSLRNRPGLDGWTVALNRPARLMARDLVLTHHGMRFAVVECDTEGVEIGHGEVTLPLVGLYNVSNLLGVLAAARALGLPLQTALRACERLSPVPGRMEQVPSLPGHPLVLVDYAHTPDALDKALQALQPLAQTRGGALWVVAGCGGDRDASKRPLMAAVAERQARHTVLTSDNPRSEDPQAILAQMVAGLTRPESVWVEVDRAQAIALAVQRAGASDVVLIAGKGHENYQDVLGVKHPFSDGLQARQALLARGAGQGGAP